MTVAPELDGMKKLIARYNPQIVVIDTIDGIQVSKMKDAISKTEALGMQLKQIATEMDTIIFSVQHITKAAAQNEKGESKELTVHSGKGSSAIEQKADRVLGLEGSRETKQRLIRSLKTRDDESFAFVVQFHADTNFRMEQI
jgi:predicted ATP-dependent serine protease